MAELPERLRAAADAHRPDRARMLARVERAMAAAGSRPADRHTIQDPDGPEHAPHPGHTVHVAGLAGPACARCAAEESARAAAGQPPVHEIGPATGQDGGPRGGEPGGAIRRPGAWDGPPAPWVRVAAVAAAVAGAVGLGGLAVGAASHDRDPKPPAVSPAHSAPETTPPPPEGAGTADLSAGRSKAPDAPQPGASGGAGRPGRTGSTHTGGSTAGASTSHAPVSPSSAVTTPSGTGGTDPMPPSPPGTDRLTGMSARAVVNSGSDSSWTEEDITLTTDQPLTSLTVELRVALTPGVSSTGQYTSAPDRTGVTTTVEGDEMVYRWTLDQGQTLDPGTYTFAGQFGHDGSDRDTSGDTFTVTAAGPDGSLASGGAY